MPDAPASPPPAAGSAPNRPGRLQTGYRRADFEEIPRRAWPCSLAMLSGWNWTPWIGRPRCRKPWTVPSSAVALTMSVGDAVRSHGERMVARRREGGGQAGEDAARIVGHRGDLAVHRRRRPVDAPAEVAADRLVAETGRRAAAAAPRRRRRPGRARCPPWPAVPGLGEIRRPSAPPASAWRRSGCRCARRGPPRRSREDSGPGSK